jgi:methyltransferase (TIGR00027 family)
MQHAIPSRTALGVAVLRALHQQIDAPPVFVDPMALRILGPEGPRLVRARRTGLLSSRLRASVAIRSRIAEDAIAARSDARQYVLLGAGLDSFAVRQPPETRLRVFEVDHPATQAWKRDMLARAGLKAPNALIFVPIDFERESLRERLSAAGFRFDAPAVFAMLGVVIYVQRAAVLQTLQLVAGLPPGGAEIVFDYAEPPEDAALSVRLATRAMAWRVASLGEPWRTFFRPEELASALRGLGFAGFEDLGSEALRARYFPHRGDDLAPGPLSHVVRSWT